MIRWLTPTLSIAWLSLCLGSAAAAEPPGVLELRTQKVDGTTYFQVRLDRPGRLPSRQQESAGLRGRMPTPNCSCQAMGRGSR